MKRWLHLRIEKFLMSPTPTPSHMVRSLVLREIEAGKRDDGLWLQAMTEAKLDTTKAQVRYLELRAQALQHDVKGLLIQQIRGAVAQDSGVRLNNASLADYLASQTLKPSDKK
jgi:hypothetical protein